MGFFNLSGFIGKLVSGLIAWFPMQYLETKYSTGIALYGFLMLVLFFSSILGYSFDRTTSNKFLQSYNENITNFYNEALGSNKNNLEMTKPGTRLLVFIWPLALGPLVPFSLLSMFWIFEIFNGNEYGTNKQYAIFWGISLMTILISFTYGYFTKALRELKIHKTTP